MHNITSNIIKVTP